MDEQQKANIANMAKWAHEAKQNLDRLGMMNANHPDPEYRLRLSQDYAVAQADWMNAQSALSAAMSGSS